MTKLIIRLFFSALSVFIAAGILSGVHIEGYLAAVVVAGVLIILNAIVRPVLVFLTIPVTFLTFGLFLLVINAVVILIANAMVSGFRVDGFWWAFIFSILISLFNSVFSSFYKDEKKK